MREFFRAIQCIFERWRRLRSDPFALHLIIWGLRNRMKSLSDTRRPSAWPSFRNYMLYNFHDSPLDLYERMMLNVRLNEELGIRIWSFPMRYQPTDRPDRTFVGEKWTRYELRALQLILQATHGVVTGEPTFFRHAFGSSPKDFQALLLRPQHYIFNRDWFEVGGGKSEFEQFQSRFRRLSEHQRRELLELLSSVDPAKFSMLQTATSDRQIRDIIPFYMLPARSKEREIWQAPRPSPPHVGLSAEEIVEDAGLMED